MIFSLADHIEQIKNGSKTQTRRTTKNYQVGKLYSIQPCRTCKAIPEGKIYIISKTIEFGRTVDEFPISERDAEAEGGYGRIEFENLYKRMYPNWLHRYRYRFRYISKENIAQPQSSTENLTPASQ